MKYAWIKENRKEFSIAVMCKIFEVRRSCYYHWLKNGNTKKESDTLLIGLIENIFRKSQQSYGTRRIKKALIQQQGVSVSRRLIGKIMKSSKLNTKSKRRFKVTTTDSKHNYCIAPNRLNRNFNVSVPDNVYVGDITYIPTDEGWLYLATVIDLYSRKIVGWSMDANMRVDLVNSALFMAIKNRKPPEGLIWHTDRGSQYAADEHRQILKQYGIIQSMSRKGDCYDNAVAESFFHSLKTELTHHINFETRSQANQAIFEYIEVFYNRQRLHSSNNYLSPVDYEAKMLQGELSA